MTEKLFINSDNNRFAELVLPESITFGGTRELLAKRYHASIDDLNSALARVATRRSGVTDASVDEQQLSPELTREIEQEVRTYDEKISAYYSCFEEWVATSGTQEQMPDRREMWGILRNPILGVEVWIAGRSVITMEYRKRWATNLYYLDKGSGNMIGFAVDSVQPLDHHRNLPSAGRSRLHAGGQELDFIKPDFDGGNVPGRAVLRPDIPAVDHSVAIPLGSIIAR